jgi:hypothetical protein
MYVAIQHLLLQNKYHSVNCMMYKKADETDSVGGNLILIYRCY